MCDVIDGVSYKLMSLQPGSIVHGVLTYVLNI
jgi:hypothetical protein